MGLDICGHFVKKTRERNEGESFGEYLNEFQEEREKEIREMAQAEIKNISKALHESEKKNKGGVLLPYEFENASIRMSKFFPYEFQRESLKNATTAKEFDDWAKKINWDCFYASSIATSMRRVLKTKDVGSRRMTSRTSWNAASRFSVQETRKHQKNCCRRKADSSSALQTTTIGTTRMWRMF